MMAVLPTVGGGEPRHEKRSFLRPSTVPTGSGRAHFEDDDLAGGGGGGGGEPLSVLLPGGGYEARSAQSVIGERRREAALRHTIRSGGAL